jgi:putative inorganic carbon (HCO3(-)) transporter
MNAGLRIANKLVSIEIWIVSAGVLISMVSTRALPWAVGIGVIFWLVRWLAWRRFSVRTPVDLGVLLLLLMIPVTLWATAIPSKTLPQVYRLVLGVIILYSIVNWTRTLSRFRLLMNFVILSGFFLALFATISVEWTTEKLPFIPSILYERFLLLVKDTVHRNVMAGNLILFLPVFLGLLLFDWKQLKKWMRLLLLLVACTVFGVLLLTQSRGALIALSVVLFALIILRWKRGWIIIPVACVALGGIIYFMGLDRLVDVLSSGVSLEGLEGRLEVLSRTIFIIQDFPFTGVGIGLFGDVVDVLYPLFLASPGTVPHAHNLFLQVAVDLGLPGLIAWGSILMVVIFSSWRIYRYGQKEANGWVAGVGAGFLCVQIALVVHGLFDSVTWGMARPAPMVWALWGLILVCGIHIESWV